MRRGQISGYRNYSLSHYYENFTPSATKTLTTQFPLGAWSTSQDTAHYVTLMVCSLVIFQHPPCLPKSHQVPTILNALQRSVQAVLVGKIQIQDWFGNGIKRAALMNKWVLKEVAFDEDERCLLQTDGSFLYLLCKDGLYKVGSGYSGTVRVCNTLSYILSLLRDNHISPYLVV